MRSPLRFGAACFRSEAVAVAVALALPMAAFPAFALDPSQPFSGYLSTHFTTDDGLPASVVDNIQQTPDGFLWLILNGTALVRFDGRQFHFFDRTVAVALAVGGNGDLWVGTREDLRRIPSDALNHSDLSGAISYRAGLGPGNEIRCLHFGRDGVLWVGTKQGLFRFDDGRFFPAGPQVEIQSIEPAGNGHLFLSTTAGFMELDNSQVVPVRELEARLGTTQDHIFRAMEDRHGDVWYSSDQGVARRSGSTWLKLQPYGPGGHGAFRTYEDAQGNVWVAKIEGLFRANAAGLELVAPKMEVRSLHSDRDGNLWVGTNGDGLYRFKDPAVRMFTTADGLPNDVIMTVLTAHDGSIWTGANCGGVTRFDGAHFRTYSEKDGLLNSCVWALAEDANHDLWIGTWGGGAYRFHEGHFSQVLTGDVRSIVAARDGSVWFGTRNGVARSKDGRIRTYTTADGLSRDITAKVFEDRKGRILAANWGGIDCFVGDRFEHLSRAPRTYAVPMGEDRTGGLFVMLEGVPIALRIDGERVDTVPELGLNRSLVETNSGELWFGSLEGPIIHRLPPGSFARPRPRDEPLDDERFGAQDGLKAEVSAGSPEMALGHDGRIWIATPRGLAMCDPHRLQNRAGSPLIYMTEVTVGRETRPAPRELRLQPGASHVEVEFAAVEVSSPEKIHMQYRLDGVDAEWLDAGPNPRAVYSNIPSGTHALHVRACNRRGIWDRVGIAYVIVQQPYFYQTAWFLAGMIAIGLVLVGGAYRLRVRQVSRQLNARFDERLRERIRVAQELHDTFLQTVQGSKLVADHALKDREDPARLLRAVEQLADWLARATEEGRAALHSLRAPDLERGDLSDALRRAIDECRAESRLDATLSVTGDARELHPIVGDEVLLIAHEAVRNACAHSRAEILKVALDHAHDLTLRVSDNGVGMDAAIVEKGKEGHFGLSGMRERAERIGGKLTITSSPVSGTTITVFVPGRIAYRSRRPG